jgi:hypothetical protein
MAEMASARRPSATGVPAAKLGHVEAFAPFGTAVSRAYRTRLLMPGPAAPQAGYLRRSLAFPLAVTIAVKGLVRPVDTESAGVANAGRAAGQKAVRAR